MIVNGKKVFSLCKTDGPSDRGPQASGVRDAFSRNVQGGSVIHGDPGEGQAHGDIHAAFEGEEFERDQPLVVVHGDIGVDPLQVWPREGGIRGEGAIHTLARIPELFNNRLDDLTFLRAHIACLSGVGIEPQDADSRFRDTEPASHRVKGQVNHVPNRGFRQARRNFLQGKVDCGEAHLEGR